MKQSEYDKKLYNREALMMDVTEDFLVVMEDMEVNKSDLAKMLCKSKSFISQTLSGSRNITLRTLADMAYVLGVKVKVSFEPNIEQSKNTFNDDDYFVNAANNVGLIVNPFDASQDNKVVKVNFASNDHRYENKEQRWYESA